MIKFISNQESLFAAQNFETASVQDVYNYFEDRTEIQVDTETTGFDPYNSQLLLLQIGDYTTQFVIDMLTIPISEFKPLLERTDKLFLFQNAKFDLRFLLHAGIDVKRVYDTFLAECILTTGYVGKERQLGLDDLAAKYADAQLDKSIRGEIHAGLTERVIKYAADDVKYLSKIKQGQMAHLVAYGLANQEDVLDRHTVLGLENRVVRVFAAMEYKGVKIDIDKWEKNSKEIQKAVIDQTFKLDDIVYNEPKLRKFVLDGTQEDLFGERARVTNINYNSPPQKVAILNALGINTDSSGDKILQSNQDKHIFIKELRTLNKLNKLNSSFGFSMLDKINPVTGRAHPDYWQILRTGRISVSDPNVNQIPARGEWGPKIRGAFVPKKGYKIVGGDYSGMELRELAHFSQDPLWLDIFKSGRDIHTVLAAQTFNIPESKVRDSFPQNPDLTYRDVQKTINYGLAYGMSKFKLADTMNVPIKVADDIIKAFFKKVPKVAAKLDAYGQFAKQKGYVLTAKPYRRRRFFSGVDRAWATNDTYTLGKIERAGKNTPIQGTNADITKLAMVNTYEVIQENNYPVDIILSVYDELQTECREDFAESWKVILEDIMKKSAEVIITTVPIVCDCTISDYWDH